MTSAATNTAAAMRSSRLSTANDEDENNIACFRRSYRIGPKDEQRTQCDSLLQANTNSYLHLIEKISHSRKFKFSTSNLLAGYLAIIFILIASSSSQVNFVAASSATIEHHHDQQQQQQQQLYPSQLAQPRVGGLEPSDYVDEAGELEVMANQQQIPTAQLMAAAGHIVPENFFLPGGSIPALYSRYAQQQHQHQQQQQQHHQQQHQQAVQQQTLVDPMQQVGSHVHPRHLAAPLKFVRQADLIAAASAAAAAAEQQDVASLIDINGYNLVSPQQDARDGGGHVGAIDLVEFLSPVGQSTYEQQQAQQQHHLVEHHHHHQQQQHQQQQQQLAAEMAAALASQHHQHQLQQHNHGHHHQHHNQAHQHLPQANLDNSAQSSENSVVEQYLAPAGSSIGPAYQISGHPQQNSIVTEYGGGGSGYGDKEAPQKPYGLPTKSSSREPSGMLKPLGNPKTVSSPAIDFVANQLPKTSNLEKLADKLPQMQTPTVFSFASSKDPVEKVKGVNQKKRNVMRQAEQIAKMMIKSINDKFGTTIGDQSDIPFLLSTLGPLGFAQNVLFDPTLLITLLNSAEKTYFSDVLPGPAKQVIRPVLNIFRVPNKKRDKANLLNIISFLTSGGQTPSTPPKHRQGTGVEKQASKASKSRK